MHNNDWQLKTLVAVLVKYFPKKFRFQFEKY